MNKALAGFKVAILVTDGFEQVEMTEPKKELQAVGAEVFIVSPNNEKVKGWQHTKWGDEFAIDVNLEQASPQDYDALLLPGGVINPDKLRINDHAIEFIAHFVKNNKPIAAICHGPWPLINANGVKGHTMTSWPSLKLDLVNAGAQWVDKEVVVDDMLVTSRKPDDIPAFNEAMIKLFSQAPSK
ncbi:MAG: type 1 glutamine amidotransferase [Gammaproteobacteria bacterium]|nr:type 1 glutamine amidotransferase [Gammaproteobacteria bacterium]